MFADQTLLLTRRDVEPLLTLDESIAVVEGAIRQHALGNTARSDVLGTHARTHEDEVVVFDSTGAVLQDVATAAAVYRQAVEQQQGVHFSFNA